MRMEGPDFAALHPGYRRSRPRHDGRLGAHRLDIVAVGIDQEGCEIARAVVGPRPGGAVVAASGLESGGMEFLDGRMAGRAERDMRAAAGPPLVEIQPERRFALGTEACARRIARAQHIIQRRQHRRIEIDAGVEICDFDSDVVIHDDLHDWRTGLARGPGNHPSEGAASRSWKILRSPREAWRNRSGDTPAARWNVRTKLERSPNPTS